MAIAVLLHADVIHAASAQITAAASAVQQEAWVAQASADLDPRAEHRLAIDPAVVADLRPRADDRWSWSQAQLSAYPSTPEGKAAAADIDAVMAAFAAANPGFTLQVNRLPRSLEVQIVHWNQNRSVGLAAAALVAALERQFAAGAGAPDAAQLRRALIEWQPNVAAALAAPGLSAHGQARAFDFQVLHGGAVIAGIDSAAARQQWDAAGWSRKLHAAVAGAGNRFAGPLASPYEPWHYAWAAPDAAR